MVAYLVVAVIEIFLFWDVLISTDVFGGVLEAP